MSHQEIIPTVIFYWSFDLVLAVFNLGSQLFSIFCKKTKNKNKKAVVVEFFQNALIPRCFEGHKSNASYMHCIWEKTPPLGCIPTKEMLGLRGFIRLTSSVRRCDPGRPLSFCLDISQFITL